MLQKERALRKVRRNLNSSGRKEKFPYKKSSMKRKEKDRGEAREFVERKCRKVVEEVWEESKSFAYDEFRRREGLKSRVILGIRGESEEERARAEREKRRRCCEIGSKVSNLFVVRNMESDWKGVGWLHMKRIFAISFIEDVFKKEAESLTSAVVEESKGSMKPKSVEYDLERKENDGALQQYPIHDLVMRKIMEKLVEGGSVLRETIFISEEVTEEEENEGKRKGDSSEKKMKEINLKSRGSQAEPITVVIPIEGSVLLKTYEQYKKHVGRPRKAKEHVAEVGDVFLLNWRQLHNITSNTNSADKKAKWITLAAARKVDHLM